MATDPLRQTNGYKTNVTPDDTANVISGDAMNVTSGDAMRATMNNDQRTPSDCETKASACADQK